MKIQKSAFLLGILALLLQAGVPASAVGRVLLDNATDDFLKLARGKSTKAMAQAVITVDFASTDEPYKFGMEAQPTGWEHLFPMETAVALAAPASAPDGQSNFFLLSLTDKPMASLSYELSPAAAGQEPVGNLTLLDLSNQAGRYLALDPVTGSPGVFHLVWKEKMQDFFEKELLELKAAGNAGAEPTEGEAEEPDLSDLDLLCSEISED